MEHTNTNANTGQTPQKSIGKGTSNSKDNSCVECTVNCLEINVFFDGTWNSRYNSDRYNSHKEEDMSALLNKPENQKKTWQPWDDDKIVAQKVLEGRLLGEDYKGGNTSFARAPTGVDQLARAFGGNERMVALYVDGAGTITPEAVDITNENLNQLPKDKVQKYGNTNAKEPNKDIAIENNRYSDDSAWGAGLGVGATSIHKWDFFNSGVKSKLRQMLQKIYVTLQQKNIKSDCLVSFNVYGFSRGAATARMFVHRVLNYGHDKDITKEVDDMLGNSSDNPITLTQFGVKFRVKFVGLFDTVSSIGTNHDDDVIDEKQQLYFNETRRPNQVVHIVAGHEFRQKFALTSIANIVQKGCGFEVVLPGCHTDIGDGLETRWVQNKITGQWENKHVEDRTTICQKYNLLSTPFMALTKLKLFSPLALSQVIRAEEKALLNLQRAEFKEIKRRLVEQGWFVESTDKTKNEIEIDDDVLTMEKIKVHRNIPENFKSGITNVSPNYPKIATKLMLEIMTDIGINRNYDLGKYHADTVDDPYFQAFSKELIDTAWEKYQDFKTNKAKYFVDNDIINGTQEGKDYYVYIKDKEKSKILFHDYLHWCSSMDRKFLSLIGTQVSVPQINPQTNQFYRTVYQG